MPQLKYFFSCMLILAMSSALHISNSGDEMGLAQDNVSTNKKGKNQMTSVSVTANYVKLDVDNYDMIGRADLVLECKFGDSKETEASPSGVPLPEVKGEELTWKWAKGEATWTGDVRNPNKF